MRSTPIAAAILLAAAALAGPAAAEPRTIYDDQGRLVLEVRADGSVVSYSFDEQGRVVKSDRPDGTKLETPHEAPPDDGTAKQ
jgi:YD repeat-containing protein